MCGRSGCRICSDHTENGFQQKAKLTATHPGLSKSNTPRRRRREKRKDHLQPERGSQPGVLPSPGGILLPAPPTHPCSEGRLAAGAMWGGAPRQEGGQGFPWAWGAVGSSQSTELRLAKLMGTRRHRGPGPRSRETGDGRGLFIHCSWSPAHPLGWGGRMSTGPLPRPCRLSGTLPGECGQESLQGMTEHHAGNRVVLGVTAQGPRAECLGF